MRYILWKDFRTWIFVLLLGGLGYAFIPASEKGPEGQAERQPAPTPRSMTEAPARDPNPPETPSGLPLYGEWRSFTMEQGLPSNKVFSVRVQGDRVWAGTDRGLALYEKGRWTVFDGDDGLPHRVVLSLDVSPRTGDLWIGTMGGLARFSAGRFDAFSQLSSGLSNDFVNEVQCDPDEDTVWAATAMGLSRLHVASGTWDVYTHENTPMHEPWTYSVAVGRGLVYVGAWGAGILEFDEASSRWRVYRDPDKEMEIDLLPNDGPVHDVTSAVDFSSGILWQGTYMGLARYDGLSWRSFYKEDSGLASNFINFVRSREDRAWLCTDDGLSVTDAIRWVTYRHRSGKGEVRLRSAKGAEESQVTETGPVHNFVLGVDFQGEDIWLATEGGISHGVRTGTCLQEPGKAGEP